MVLRLIIFPLLRVLTCAVCIDCRLLNRLIARDSCWFPSSRGSRPAGRWRTLRVDLRCAHDEEECRLSFFVGSIKQCIAINKPHRQREARQAKRSSPSPLWSASPQNRNQLPKTRLLCKHQHPDRFVSVSFCFWKTALRPAASNTSVTSCVLQTPLGSRPLVKRVSQELLLWACSTCSASSIVWFGVLTVSGQTTAAQLLTTTKTPRLAVPKTTKRP